MPRLYTRLGATLFALGQIDEALATINDGLQLHPNYRPLRVWRIFVLSAGDSDRLALLDALELMLESLAPSRWDVFESDIVALVRQMCAEQSNDQIQAAGDPGAESAQFLPDGDELKTRDSHSESGARIPVAVSKSNDDSEKSAAFAEIDVAVHGQRAEKETTRS